jgi:hypothetical protein
LPDVDLIIVTPFVYFDSIKETLLKLVDCPIVSIETIICPK